MITDIPSPDAYQKTALSLLNLAWESSLELSVALAEAKDGDPDAVEEKEYWAACQTQLTTAIALIQQAMEFTLKAKIAAVSPYLLIAGPPKDWPKDCHKKDVPFADFYAIDAQELIRAHDTVATDRLPDRVKVLFEDMRKIRNSIMHTVDSRLRVEVPQVVLAILEFAEWAIGPHRWTQERRRLIEESPNSIAYASFSDHSTYLVARELLNTVEILQPADVERLFGFDKKQRRYICPGCATECADDGIEPNLAFLKPNDPTSTNVHCYICDHDYAVFRQDCSDPSCKGNVIESGDEMRCLSCMAAVERQIAPAEPTAPTREGGLTSDGGTT